MWRLVFLIMGGMILLTGTAWGSAITLTSDLPPDTGEYRTPALVDFEYAFGGNIIELSGFRHHSFINITHPSCVGCEFDQFDSTVDADLTLNGSSQGHVVLQGQVLDIVFNKNVGTPGIPFQTEMLQLNLSGNTPIGPALIRESPTLPSTGQTQIDDLGNGSFRISSFFDVFTELSLDGGVSWIPSSSGASRVELEAAVPEPATMTLVGVGLGWLALLPWWKRWRGERIS